MISTAPLDGSSNELCDWLELTVLAASDQRALLGSVNIGLEMEEDFEYEDLAEEDEIRERRVQLVLAAIDERSAAMPTAYPFSIDATGAYLELKPTVTSGGTVYLFCLIVSNGARNGLLAGEGPWVPDLVTARDLFQICATVSCAGWIRGPSFSFGWPRIDGQPFLQKLHQIYPRYGDGRPHAAMPAWGPADVKDDAIDVLAFKHEPDGRAGTGYVVAQAASGANWTGKSVKNAVDVFHKTWFVHQPASPPLPTLAMPFALTSPSDVASDDHVGQDAIAGTFWRTTNEMGVLLYRHRIAHNVDEAVALANAGITPIERIDELPAVSTYVNQYRDQLRAAIEALA